MQKRDLKQTQKHKKAFIDQIMLGFFLFAALIIFGATVSDEYEARTKALKLQEIAKNSTRALAKSYMYNEDMTESESINNDILSTTKLGQELIDNNNIDFIWRDLTGDGSPNVVTTVISGYTQENFWFKLLDLDDFTIPDTDWTEYVTKDQSDIISIVMRYGGSNAGYHNMIGTYELDSDGCITNANLVLVNKEDHDVGDELGSYSNLDTRFFIVPDGYDRYGNRSATLNSSISIEGCPPDIPETTIDGNTDSGVVYFQDTEFNTDNGYDHMREVGKEYFDDYEAFISQQITYCSRYRRNGNCRRWSTRDATWEDWVDYAADNNIDFANDPNDEYIITMEDLPDGGDKDFNDINLDTTKVRIPKSVDTVDIEDGVDVSP